MKISHNNDLDKPHGDVEFSEEDLEFLVDMLNLISGSYAFTTQAKVKLIELRTRFSELSHDMKERSKLRNHAFAMRLKEIQNQ